MRSSLARTRTSRSGTWAWASLAVRTCKAAQRRWRARCAAAEAMPARPNRRGRGAAETHGLAVVPFYSVEPTTTKQCLERMALHELLVMTCCQEHVTLCFETLVANTTVKTPSRPWHLRLDCLLAVCSLAGLLAYGCRDHAALTTRSIENCRLCSVPSAEGPMSSTLTNMFILTHRAGARAELESWNPADSANFETRPHSTSSSDLAALTAENI